MSKERLEEIKQYLIHFYNAVDVEEDIKVYIFNTLKIEWLIEQAEEVERLKGLEESLRQNIKIKQEGIDFLKQENERYREAIDSMRLHAHYHDIIKRIYETLESDNE